MEQVSIASALWQPPSDQQDCEVAISPALWQALLEQSADDEDEPEAGPSSTPLRDNVKRIGVCLSASSHSDQRDGRSQSVLCWARPTGPAETSKTSEPFLLLDPALRSSQPDLLGGSHTYLDIQPVDILQLSGLFLCAKHRAAYEWAQKPQNLQDLLYAPSFTDRIYRQGEEVRTDTNGGVYEYRIAMTEPVLQGTIAQDSTQIVVLPPAGLAGPSSRGPVASTRKVSQARFDVDEDFLAASMMGRLEVSVPAVAKQHNGAAHSNGSGKELEARKDTVRVITLQRKVEPNSIRPTPSAEEDEEIQAFVRTSDLGRLGLFSGSYVSITDVQSAHKRVVRVYAYDGAFDSSDEQSDPLLALSPFLMHNMGDSAKVEVKLFNAGREIPWRTAKAVTIARVASEHSMHRQYQVLLLQALKEYFQAKRRVLRMGDIVALAIDDGLARFTNAESDVDAEKQMGEDDYELPVTTASEQAIAYFKVTSMDAGTDLDDEGIDSYLVDSTSTTMVQAGIENHPAMSNLEYLRGAQDVAPASSAPAARLQEYLKACLRDGTANLDLSLTVLIQGARGSGKATLARWAAKQSGYHTLELDCYDLLGETDVKTEGNFLARVERAAACTPCMLILRHIEALARKSQAVESGQEPTISATLQEAIQIATDAWKKSSYPLVILGTVSEPDQVPVSVIGCFKENLTIAAPGETERLSILQNTFNHDVLAPDVSLKNIAVQTAALVATNLVDLAARVRMFAAGRLAKARYDLDACRKAGVPLLAEDFTAALDQARSSYSESIGAPKIPNVTWDDVGGLAAVKSEILDTIQLPLQHPELFADGLKKRSGVLLYGPPGTGKTLLAKAVATSCALNFFSVKGPELLNMYIGESEANVRRVFQRARDAKPCVIFFDELDSVAPKRGNQGDSGGVMDRIVSQLLAELDGMSEGQGGSDVFVIGATNRPDLLDPALLRPGRFDRMLYLGVSDTHEAQLKIIEALTRKFKLDPAMDLRAIAEACPFNYTGADFYALCSDAMLKAMARKAEEVDAKIAVLNEEQAAGKPSITPQYYLAELAKAEDIQVLVSQRDFEQALAELVPSVSEAEMEHYRVVQQKFNPTKAAVEVNGQSQNVTSKRKGKGKAREE